MAMYIIFLTGKVIWVTDSYEESPSNTSKVSHNMNLDG